MQQRHVQCHLKANAVGLNWRHQIFSLSPPLPPPSTPTTLFAPNLKPVSFQYSVPYFPLCDRSSSKNWEIFCWSKFHSSIQCPTCKPIISICFPTSYFWNVATECEFTLKSFKFEASFLPVLKFYGQLAILSLVFLELEFLRVWFKVYLTSVNIKNYEKNNSGKCCKWWMLIGMEKNKKSFNVQM